MPKKKPVTPKTRMTNARVVEKKSGTNKGREYAYDVDSRKGGKLAVKDQLRWANTARVYNITPEQGTRMASDRSRTMGRAFNVTARTAATTKRAAAKKSTKKGN